MPTIKREVEIEFEVWCGCGNILLMYIDKDGNIVVYPCVDCLESAKLRSHNEGYKRGYSAGQSDGHALGYDQGYEDGHRQGDNDHRMLAKDAEDAAYQRGYAAGHDDNFAVAG